MNPFDDTTRRSSSSSTSASGDEVEHLLKELVPTSYSWENSHSPRSTERVPTKQDETIVTSVHKIDDIRKTVNQMKDVNVALETMLHTYEVSPNPDDRLSLQKKISLIIERGNAIAASSRVGRVSTVLPSLPFRP